MTPKQANRAARLIFRVEKAAYAAMLSVGKGEKDFRHPLHFLSSRIDNFLINEGISEALFSLKEIADSPEYLEWLASYEASEAKWITAGPPEEVALRTEIARCVR